jgi:hypothetical protein
MRPTLELLLGVCFAAAAGGTWMIRRHFAQRKDPEVRRREFIDRRGRLIEGTVTDYHGGVIVYTWSWRGVDYEASQDCRALLHRLPESKDALIGSVTVKFIPSDPANSMVVSENWSGFHRRVRR